MAAASVAACGRSALTIAAEDNSCSGAGPTPAPGSGTGRRNSAADFVGIADLKKQHARQVAAFESWAARGAWSEFHSAHYDWWAFPYDQPSSHGFAYVVYEGDVADLKADPAFLAAYLRGAELLLRSWGWHMGETRELRRGELDDPAAQRWARWPVRLHKAASSLLLFGCDDAARSAILYGRLLLTRRYKFSYGGRDLSELFTRPPIPLEACAAGSEVVGVAAASKRGLG
jgi:hypothetical protein